METMERALETEKRRWSQEKEKARKLQYEKVISTHWCPVKPVRKNQIWLS